MSALKIVLNRYEEIINTIEKTKAEIDAEKNKHLAREKSYFLSCTYDRKFETKALLRNMGVPVEVE